MEINLNEIRIEPILESMHREKISDEVYFSDKYRDFISNSRLKLMNPAQGGDPQKYKAGMDGKKTSSLFLGSCIHCLVLQKDEFTLGPDLKKPSAKLGMVIDSIKVYRKNGYSIYNSIVNACKHVGYYAENINNWRISQIIKEGLYYYINSKSLDDTIILASPKDRNTIINCVNNLANNYAVKTILNPTDMFGEPIPSFNEEAFFLDFKVTFQEKEHIIKFKMKADNWTIDLDNKIITLNDLKTTSHMSCKFMSTSWKDYNYDRQFAGYIYVLLRYCEKEYGYNSNDWTVKANVIVSETGFDNRCTVFPITLDMLQRGRKEFCKLLKMVAYCEMFDYPEVTFI